MEYAIQWIGEVFLGVSSDSGRQVGLSLLKGHPIPAEFKEDDRVRIAPATEPYEPYSEEARNRLYFTVTHIPTSKTLLVWHENDRWMSE